MSTCSSSHRERAARLFSAFDDTLQRTPMALGEMLLAVDFEVDTAKEVLLVRPEDGADAAALLDVLRTTYLPNRIVSVVSQGEELDAHAQLVPLLRGKKARNGEVTAYVCEDRVCRFPTADPAVFADQLARVKAVE